MYESYQETSIVALVNEMLRRSTTPGDMYYGLIHTSVPENSAVGEKQSNSRAETSAQTFDDMLKTYKSVMKARMGCHLPSNHPVVYWLTQHAAHTYNRYFVNDDGKNALRVSPW